MTMADKHELRERLRRLRRTVPADARERASRDVCARLSAMPLGDVVAVYLATADELDLSGFIADALSRGVTLLAPRWTGDGYELARLRGLSPSDVQPGPHGVLEPRQPEPPGSVPMPPGPVPTPTAWVVPGLAFTRGGVRLGYGGGWYDRMLGAGTGHAQRRVGVAYPFQVVEEIPCEPHDVRLTEIVVAGEAEIKEEEK